MTSSFQQELEELKWLKSNPQFKMRPATIVEFLGPGYLDDDKVRPGIRQALVDVFGDTIDIFSISPVRRACITGGIGIGKTTFASIALTYMVHWVSCLKDPQGYFGLMKGTTIAFMMMSTSMKQAQEVVFNDVKSRINNSDWFKMYCNVINDKMTTQMRFPESIWIVPGTSVDTSFEGYNILGGIIDEGDSHKITPKKDYAASGYDTINSRIASRFTDFKRSTNRGLLIAIGQMKSKSGFMAATYSKFLVDPEAIAVKMSIWESFGWHNFTKDKDDVERGIETSERDSFWFDTRSKKILMKEAVQYLINHDLIEVPMTYMNQFTDDPVKALRDLAGIPPEAEDPFISRTDKILENQEAWERRYETGSPIDEKYTLDDIVLPDWVKPHDDYKRVIHIDTAYSAAGDALGFAMGHVPEKIMIYEEERPIIVFDILMRLKARSGTQINFAQLRSFIYNLSERGFDIDRITMDGFETTDFMQELAKRRYKVEYLSVDRKKTPYEDLREAINDVRCEHPALITLIKPTDLKPVNIPYKELSELSDTGRKIDHPPMGSKDISDAMAGVVTQLVSGTRYTRAARSADDKPLNQDSDLEQFISGGTYSDDSTQVVDFETFAKQQEKYLSNSDVPGVDFNVMTSGAGMPGYTQDDRVI